MSVALKAVAWAWRFTQTVKTLDGFQGTGESRLPSPLEPGESWLPGVQSTGELFYCLYENILCWSSFVSYQSEIFTDFRKLGTYVTYNLWKFQIDSFKIYPWRNYAKIKVKK